MVGDIFTYGWWLGGWSEYCRVMLNSTQDQVEVELGAWQYRVQIQNKNFNF